MNTRKYIDNLGGKLNTVGNNMKIAGGKNNLSRQTVIDISSQSIFDIETGSRTVIDYELCAFAKILNTSTDALLKDFRNYLDKI